MTTWKDQMDALGTALLLIQRLPQGTTWSLTCTNDDTAESPSVLNIYVIHEGWPQLCERMRLSKPTTRSSREDEDQYVSYRQGALLISLIELTQ